ncbi:MAG: sugar ABC transporter, partial [Burkholderiaceae bacterium]|nr:sugar ABC transporter [Burkholderiaceae bacterium]
MKALLAPEHLTERGRWLEVIGIPLLVVGMAWWWNPEDPLLLKAAFPWLWFAPALVALRYGVLAGLLAGMVLLINWLLANAWNVAAITATEFPRDYFFGGGLLVLLAGEFSDVWRDRIARMDETNLYVTERLSRLTKRHLLLNISHDRMEQEMLARPGSLRDALASLRNVVMTADKTHSPLPGLPELLNLLAQYINIEAASVYQVEEKNGRILLGTALQTMGAPHPLEPHDELFELMVETRSMAHVAGSDVSLERQSQQLIVAPLIASNSQILGVLAVTKLPFYSLNVESLQMMAVTLGY